MEEEERGFLGRGCRKGGNVKVGGGGKYASEGVGEDHTSPLFLLQRVVVKEK